MSRLASTLTILTATFALAAACSARTVGSGKLASETRPVSGFHAVELATTGTLEITPGDKEELVVEAEDNILPLIETTVKSDGTLLIAFKSHENVETTKPLSFKLSAKTLDRIGLSGSGDIHVGGKLAVTSENIRLPGSGHITLDDLETGALTVALEGSGRIKIAGAASDQKVALDGSGNYEAGKLKSDVGEIVINGSGNCTLWTEKTLRVNIRGSGKAAYHGKPELMQVVSGSGEVKALD